jgi:hypothetical protein
VTESTRPLNSAIDRLPAEVFVGFGQLATTLGESRASLFPVFARGASPIPGKRGGAGGHEHGDPLRRRGGPSRRRGGLGRGGRRGGAAAQAVDVLAKAKARVESDSAMTLDAWEKRHRAAVEAALGAKGYRLS